jgi:hypothetical protein
MKGNNVVFCTMSYKVPLPQEDFLSPSMEKG